MNTCLCVCAVPWSLYSDLQQHGEPEDLALGDHLSGLHVLLFTHLHSHWWVGFQSINQCASWAHLQPDNRVHSLYRQACTASWHLAERLLQIFWCHIQEMTGSWSSPDSCLEYRLLPYIRLFFFWEGRQVFVSTFKKRTHEILHITCKLYLKPVGVCQTDRSSWTWCCASKGVVRESSPTRLRAAADLFSLWFGSPSLFSSPCLSPTWGRSSAS